tara:strand:- start:79 stop:1329 length:1251 start_codon:yes stop_codon:yes gene_type:complete
VFLSEKELKKKITIIGINYYPEDTAIGLYTSQLASYYNTQGFEVSVVTGFPYYPAWKIGDKYKAKQTFYFEMIDGIAVYRYKQYVPANPTFIKRMFHLLDFLLGTFVNIFKIKQVDVVLCIVPFIGSIFLGKILSKIRKAKLWVHVQDFEFDAVLESNMIKNKSHNSLIFQGLFWVEKKLLNSADMLSTISTSMLLKLENKTSNQIRTKLLPNWVDLNFINSDNYKKHPYLESSKFTILYSGNIGEKQDWDLFLELVAVLEKDSSIAIIVVGDGGKREWLTQQLVGLQNVSLHAPVPYAELSDLLCSADLHILFQKNDVIDTVMPSKILAMMGSQRPSLISGNSKSEVASIIKASAGGKYIGTGKTKDVLEFIQVLKSNKEAGNNLGKNARKYVSLKFSKKEILEDFSETLANLIK